MEGQERLDGAEKSENNILSLKVVALWKFIDRGFRYFSPSIKPNRHRNCQNHRDIAFLGRARSRSIRPLPEKQIAPGNIFAPPNRRRWRWRRHRAINSQSRKTINYSDICFKTVTGRVKDWMDAEEDQFGGGRNSGIETLPLYPLVRSGLEEPSPEDKSVIRNSISSQIMIAQRILNHITISEP